MSADGGQFLRLPVYRTSSSGFILSRDAIFEPLETQDLARGPGTMAGNKP